MNTLEKINNEEEITIPEFIYLWNNSKDYDKIKIIRLLKPSFINSVLEDDSLVSRVNREFNANTKLSAVAIVKRELGLSIQESIKWFEENIKGINQVT